MPDNPLVSRVLNGKTPAELAKYLIDNTKLNDVAVRKQLYQGGKAAIDASTDPLIVLMREDRSRGARGSQAIRRRGRRRRAPRRRRHRENSLRHGGHQQLSRRHVYAAPQLRRGPRLHGKWRRHRAKGHQAPVLHHHRRRI